MSEKSGFRKNASVVTLAVATNDGSSFKKSAAYKEDATSAYLSGARTIDIKAALNIVAKEYDISSNPEDYVFEAIRGNTTNVPNENSDGFHKHELLRFDHRLGKQVYRTYELKPHHVNHRAENPKNARGFIVDAHYNDSKPPLDTCPKCQSKTAEVGARDTETGIHCIKCGAVVKDEFVELLVAVDRQKDPTFAQGVMTGILKNGSMGCSCLRTRCNICANVAYTRSEFCAHIRNKGKEYDESEPGFNPIAFMIEHKGKTAGKPRKTAKSFEWCEGVIFDEYSRVHDPADPKAEQYEILKLSSKVAELESGDKLRNESEILMLQTRLSELEKKVSEKLMAKTAQVTPPAAPAAPPGTPPAPTDAVPPSPEGVMPPPEGVMPPAPVSLEEDGKGGVTINIDTKAPGSVDIQSGEPVEEVPGIPLEEMTPESEGATPAGPGEALTPEAMGIMPGAPGAAAPGAPAVPPRRGASVVENSILDAIFQDLGGPSMLRFANSYKHIKAEITSAKNIRIFDDEGTLFVVKPDRVTADSKAASKTGADLAKTVLTMVAEYGIGGTIKRTNAIVGPRLAQVLEYAVDDMKGEERGKTDSVLDEAETDTEDKRDGVEHSVTEGGSDTDHQEEYDTKGLKDDVLTDRETNMEDEEHNVGDAASLLKGGGGAVKNPESDTREKRKDWTLNQSAVDDVNLDHKEKAAAKTAQNKVCEKCESEPCECKDGKGASKYEAKRHAARIEAIYRARLDKKVAEIEQEKETFRKNLQERWVKAMKLIARRQALNLEYSPLKTAVGIALCNPCPLDSEHDYEPMDQKTAVTLIEAAFNDAIIEGTDKPAWEANIDALVDRAASIMNMSDEALMQVEADLKNIRAASIPLDDMLVRPPMSDSDLRTAAKNGNLQLNPSSVETAQSKDLKRNAIRQAVGTTKVAGLASISR